MNDIAFEKSLAKPTENYKKPSPTLSTLESASIHSLSEVVDYARALSPYYGQLYRDVASAGVRSIAELPLVSQKDFWNANTLTENRLLTGPLTDGFVFKSGGTTGTPKFSVFTRKEWHRFTLAFGRGLADGGLRSGHRVANLFYAGEMYASFIFIMKSLELAAPSALQFPLAGTAKPEEVLKTIQDFKIDTIAGVPTGLTAIASYYEKYRSAIGDLPLKRILYGGEGLYADQMQRLRDVFPGVEVSSIGYASVDGGLLGYADNSCTLGEHRSFGEETILEIIDEVTGEPITEQERPGKIVITSLTRLLMPIIRYPAGDRGYWTEPTGANNRKFMLLGRSEEAARIGPVSIYFEDARRVLEGLGLSTFQMVLKHRDLKDELVLRILVPRQGLPDVFTAFYQARPMFIDSVRKDKIHPLSIEWVTDAEFEVNPRTGKLIRILDRRHDGSSAAVTC